MQYLSRLLWGRLGEGRGDENRAMGVKFLASSSSATNVCTGCWRSNRGDPLRITAMMKCDGDIDTSANYLWTDCPQVEFDWSPKSSYNASINRITHIHTMNTCESPKTVDRRVNQVRRACACQYYVVLGVFCTDFKRGSDFAKSKSESDLHSCGEIQHVERSIYRWDEPAGTNQYLRKHIF